MHASIAAERVIPLRYQQNRFLQRELPQLEAHYIQNAQLAQYVTEWHPYRAASLVIQVHFEQASVDYDTYCCIISQSCVAAICSAHANSKATLHLLVSTCVFAVSTAQAHQCASGLSACIAAQTLLCTPIGIHPALIDIFHCFLQTHLCRTSGHACTCIAKGPACQMLNHHFQPYAAMCTDHQTDYIRHLASRQRCHQMTLMSSLLVVSTQSIM